MKFNKERLVAGGLTLWLVLLVFGCAGWITNLYWLVTECISYGADTNMVRVTLSAVGVFVAPLGALHGVVSWFV